MNIDNFVANSAIRQKNFEDKIKARTVKCKNVQKYADKQNTIYNKCSNKMLYGVNNKMAAFGVSDGTSDQLDQLLVLKSHQLGAGAAGANPCVFEKFENNQTDDTNSYKITDNVVSGLLVFIMFFMIFNRNSI
jgi:hypothetical protein